MLVLLALIARAVALEFRSQTESPVWRQTWDVVFCVASTLATLLFGVGVGNAMIGVPLNERGIYVGGFFGLLNPYSLLVGLLALTMFLMHGSLYLHLKTTGELHERIGRWLGRTYGAFVTVYVLTSAATLWLIPRATAFFQTYPATWLVVVLNVLAVASIPVAIRRGWSGRAFLASCLTVCAFVLLLGLALFPNLVTSHPTPQNSLTIYTAASSQKTLWIMLIIALLGMPFVIAYTSIIYWVFRRRVVVGEGAYH
jgi:cytochrome bd ubiquinol oxidase subunit II